MASANYQPQTHREIRQEMAARMYKMALESDNNRSKRFFLDVAREVQGVAPESLPIIDNDLYFREAIK